MCWKRTVLQKAELCYSKSRLRSYASGAALLDWQQNDLLLHYKSFLHQHGVEVLQITLKAYEYFYCVLFEKDWNKLARRTEHY